MQDFVSIVHQLCKALHLNLALIMQKPCKCKGYDRFLAIVVHNYCTRWTSNARKLVQDLCMSPTCVQDKVHVQGSCKVLVLLKVIVSAIILQNIV